MDAEMDEGYVPLRRPPHHNLRCVQTCTQEVYEELYAFTDILEQMRMYQERLKKYRYLKRDIILVRRELTDFTDKVFSAGERAVAIFEGKIRAFQHCIRQSEEAQSKYTELKAELNRLRNEYIAEDQLGKANDIIIKGVVETENENLFELICRIADFIGKVVKQSDIVFIIRDPTQVSEQHKPIIVRFKYYFIKKSFSMAFDSATEAQVLTCSNIGLPGDQLVTISDHVIDYERFY